jgi:hypothetical protein
MTQRPTARERAFELASSGECASMKAIKAQLRREGYWAVDELLTGAGIETPLRQAWTAARKTRRAQAWRRLLGRFR